MMNLLLADFPEPGAPKRKMISRGKTNGIPQCSRTAGINEEPGGQHSSLLVRRALSDRTVGGGWGGGRWEVVLQNLRVESGVL